MMRRLLLSWVTVLAVLVGLSVSVQAAPPASSPTTCTGVWVVVNNDMRCATSYATGEEALTRAGFSVERTKGMVCRIDGVPERCVVSKDAYWSYWQATRNPDGSFSAWTYATVGAHAYTPKQGDAEGWAFGNGQPPTTRPPRGSTIAASTGPVPTSATPTATESPASPSSGGSATTTVVFLGVLVVAAGFLVWRFRSRR